MHVVAMGGMVVGLEVVVAGTGRVGRFGGGSAAMTATAVLVRPATRGCLPRGGRGILYRLDLDVLDARLSSSRWWPLLS